MSSLRLAALAAASRNDMNKRRLIVAGFTALGIMWTIHFAANRIGQYGPIGGHVTKTTEGPSALVRSLRPNYPYSVIAGGAYSPAEVRFADNKDPIVRAHYSDFDLKKVQMVRLTDDRFQYVSYRLKDQIYWTKKKLRIPSGELLLTDGTQYARARCGNRLSDRLHKDPTSNQEPSGALLSLPPVSMDLLPQFDFTSAPVTGQPVVTEARTSPAQPSVIASLPHAEPPLVPLEAVWGGQPIIGGGGFISSSPGGGIGGTTGSPVVNPASPNPVKNPPIISTVPEPSTICLFLVTLVFACWAFLRAGSKDRDEHLEG